MKKLACIILIVCTLVSLTACGGKKEEESAAGFKPVLDTETSCNITVAGSYDNFEALEAEFDRFNAFYPNVRLSYVKLDDYQNTLGTVLEGNDKPNISFSTASMIGNEKYDYTFAPIPLTEEGGYFIDSPSVEFSVNKDCDDLDMTNEFMRFLIAKEELNEMASVKRLVTPTNERNDGRFPLPLMHAAVQNDSA